LRVGALSTSGLAAIGIGAAMFFLNATEVQVSAE
jgi:hypothetical protein